jgi:hypothetical protein
VIEAGFSPMNSYRPSAFVMVSTSALRSAVTSVTTMRGSGAPDAASVTRPVIEPCAPPACVSRAGTG